MLFFPKTARNRKTFIHPQFHWHGLKAAEKYHFCVIYQKQSGRNLLWALLSQQTARFDRHRETEEKLFYRPSSQSAREKKKKISFRTQAKRRWKKEIFRGDYFEFFWNDSLVANTETYFFSLPNSNAVKTGEVFSGLRKLFRRQHFRLLNQAQGSI